MTSLTNKRYDVVVVGAGIIGLATAWAARQQGLAVAVVERQPAAVGASVRNFGFITVTGQRRGEHWRRAHTSLAVWRRIAPQAGIPIVHEGLFVLAQREEAAHLMEAFLKTEMGENCQLFSGKDLTSQFPILQSGYAALYSPHECRVESRDAIPKITSWLEKSLGVDFYWKTAVIGISLPEVFTSRGNLKTEHCIVCPGNDLNTLYPDWVERARVRQCTLQMLRVSSRNPETRLPGAIMSDLSLVRYEGYADLPEAEPLKRRVAKEQGLYLEKGIHLIAVQSQDGSLVVGDSHVYGDSESPFATTEVDDLILSELHRVIRWPDTQVTERWTGTYASAENVVLKVSPSPKVVLGMVTGGTGASTSFAFAQELLELALAGRADLP